MGSQALNPSCGLPGSTPDALIFDGRLTPPEIGTVKKNDGQNLQRLIRAIESVRNPGVQVKIKSPKRIKDKITGRLRGRHDIVLTYTLAHHELVLALECRDRSRPVEVDAVEAFRSKCESTDIRFRNYRIGQRLRKDCDQKGPWIQH